MKGRRVVLTGLITLVLTALMCVGTAVASADGPGVGEAEVDPPVSPTPEEWDKSSLFFDEGYGCQGECEAVTARVCNEQDSKDMTGSTTWELYWAASGNPKDGTVIASGTVEPLPAGQCQTLSYSLDDSSDDASGNYKFKIYQPVGHPGQGELWSESCEITCQEPPTETPEPPEEPVPPEEPEPTEPEELHPVGSTLASFFDATYDEIMAWHEDGVGFGKIAKAYYLAGELDDDELTAAYVLDKLANMGWGRLMKTLGLHPGNKGKNLGWVMSGHADDDGTSLGETDNHPGKGHGPPEKVKDKNQAPPGQNKSKGKGK